MKRLIAVTVMLSFVLYLGNLTTYAQQGRHDRPAVQQDRRTDATRDARQARDSQRDSVRHDQNKATGKHDQNQATGKHDQNQATGKHDQNQATGKHDQNQATGKHDQNQATGKHDVARDKQKDQPAVKHDANRDRTVHGDWVRNPQLRERLNAMLPGVDLAGAASGFKNQGQFVAALHASHNLGIPFNELKSQMTGPHSKSLGEAIHQLKPDVEARAAAKNAEKQAKDTLKQTKAIS